MASRDTHFMIASSAEKEERWNDAFESMKKLIMESLPTESAPSGLSTTSNSPLPTEEEKRLFCLVVDKVLQDRLSRWFELQAKMRVEENMEALIKLTESTDAAHEALEAFVVEVALLLDKKLIFKAEVTESVDELIFYNKMKGDFLVQDVQLKQAEFLSAQAQKDQEAATQIARRLKARADQAKAAFTLACGLANDSLSPAHPVRLRLSISVANFLQRVVNNPDLAFETANQAFREGMADLEANTDDVQLYKEAGQALKDLTRFMKSLEGEGEEEEEGGEGGEEKTEKS